MHSCIRAAYERGSDGSECRRLEGRIPGQPAPVPVVFDQMLPPLFLLVFDSLAMMILMLLSGV